MPYVPNLIPEHAQLPPEVQQSVNGASSGRKSLWLFFSYFGAVLFFLASLSYLFTRFWEGFLFAGIGFLMLPKVHERIERRFRFRFTWLIKTLAITLVWLVALVLSVRYDKRDTNRALQAQQEQEQLEAEELLRAKKAEEKEKRRIVRLQGHLQKAEEWHSEKDLNQTLLSLDSAMEYAQGDSLSIIALRASYYHKDKNYTGAIDEYSLLIASKVNTAEHLYQRALCYEELDDRATAVEDLKAAHALGHENAEKLQEKINPVKTRISHYVTRCCDGSTSSSKGQGACSHHGGVCNWNEAVYTSYRDY